MMIWFVLWLLCVQGSVEKGEYKTEYACEGQTLQLNCESGHVIRLLRANFGRFSISICNEHGNLDWSVDCTSHRSYHIIYARCNHMSNCIVSASSDTFSDPCPGTFKYLEVQYQCILEALTITSSWIYSSSSSVAGTTRPPIIIPVTRPKKTSTAASTISTGPLPTTTTTTTTARTSSTSTTEISTEINIERPPTTNSPFFNSEEHCPPVYSRNLTWDWTKVGTEVVQKCPGGTFGEARWLCSMNPVRWVPDYPDLSDCTSLWVDNLKTRIEGEDSVVNIAAELSVMTHRKPLYGGDIRHTTQILHRLIDKMAEKTKEIANSRQRHQLLQELLDSAVDVAGNLLNVPSSWEELSFSKRNYFVTTLMQSLERGGWLLAAAHKSHFDFRKFLPNIFLSVQVREMWYVSDIVFPVKKEDSPDVSVHIPKQSALNTASNGVVRTVFSTYSQVQDFFESTASSRSGILQNSSRIINSQIVSVSVGSLINTKLNEPIQIIFKLIQEDNVTNPQCVFWDDTLRVWSEEGCWVQKYNRSHVTCKCNHLTNFALLMDVGSNDQPAQEVNMASKVVTFISCSICILIFVGTAILRIVFRNYSSEHAAIHQHLCLCFTSSEIIIMCSVEKISSACSFLAGALHFFLQAVFVWLFFAALQLYLLCTEITPKSRIQFYVLVAYGMSALIVAISAIVDPESYGNRDTCFLRFENYYVFTFVGPALCCLMGAVLFLALKTYLLDPRNIEVNKIEASKFQNRDNWIVLLITGLFCTFLLFFMNLNLPIFSYIFALVNIIHSLVIFICLGLHNSDLKEIFYKWREDNSKRTENQFSAPAAPNQHIDLHFLQPATNLSTFPAGIPSELEYQLGNFRHADLCHNTRSPIYDNHENLSRD